MSKQIAILRYMIMFNPADAWSTGYEFENQFADFFAAHGLEAQIVESKGGSGERVIFVTKIETIPMRTDKPDTRASDQIKQVQQKVAPKDFKQFKNPQHSRAIPPKLGFNQPGNSNRQKVRVP